MLIAHKNIKQKLQLKTNVRKLITLKLGVFDLN